MDEKLELFWENALKFKIQQKKEEWIDFTKELLKHQPIKYALEIGCYDGGTTIFLSNLCENLITMDQQKLSRFDQYKYNLGDPNLYGSELLNTITNFTYVPGNSHDKKTFEEIEFLLSGNKLDLLFIDGDHTYNGVKEDYNMYSKLVRDGGIIAFHDIHESSFHESHGCYVHNFWREISEEYKENKVFYCGEGPGNVWGGIGLIIK